MRTLAMSILTAAGLAIAVSAAIPASAEEGVTVGIGPGGLGVGVHERDRDWRHHYARDRDDVVIRGERHCRVTVIHEEGMTKRIKRCD